MKKNLIIIGLLGLLAIQAIRPEKQLAGTEVPERLADKGYATGIGGIFFKATDPVGLKKWYAENLGLQTDQYGTMFEFREAGDPETPAYLQWSPFSKATKYFDPSKKDFMINYRVKNIDALVEQMKENGVTLLDTIARYPYGDFVHVMDPDGNNIELWEPVDRGFEKEGEGGVTK